MVDKLYLDKIALEKELSKLLEEIKFLKLGLCDLCDDISEYEGDLPPPPKCGNCKGSL